MTTPISTSSTGDMKKVFPFLKLSGELRNNIYEYSLAHDRANGQLANTSLLRVNKEVHSEAKSLLPTVVNSVSFRVAMETTGSEPNLPTVVRITGDIQASIPRDTEPNTFTSFIPDIIRKTILPNASRINIEFDLPLQPALDDNAYDRACAFVKVGVVPLLDPKLKRAIVLTYLNEVRHNFPKSRFKWILLSSDCFRPFLGDLKHTAQYELQGWGEKTEYTFFKCLRK